MVRIPHPSFPCQYFIKKTFLFFSTAFLFRPLPCIFSGCPHILAEYTFKGGLTMIPCKENDLDDLIFQDEWEISTR